jgi:hypothetical protein
MHFYIFHFLHLIYKEVSLYKATIEIIRSIYSEFSNSLFFFRTCHFNDIAIFPILHSCKENIYMILRYDKINFYKLKRERYFFERYF